MYNNTIHNNRRFEDRTRSSRSSRSSCEHSYNYLEIGFSLNICHLNVEGISKTNPNIYPD